MLSTVPSGLFAIKCFLLVCGPAVGVYVSRDGFGGTKGPLDKDW